jgi:glyoxylase-like metal-dependent hydrolase (beta-lactamase superfamily II)
MRVLEGVHQIKVPAPAGVSLTTNTYVLEGENGHILVDTGWDSQEALWALQEGIRGSNLKLRDIKQVVITHIHPDHYGLSSKIRQVCGAQLAIHSLDADFIFPRYKDSADLVAKIELLLRQNGVPEEELPQLKDASLWMNKYVTPELPDLMLEDGQTISNGSFDLEVLWTPGHSPGHVCLYERKRRFILTGDHVLFDTTPHIGFNPQSGDNPLGDYVTSLKKLSDLKVSFALPGHGPVFNALGLRIDRILLHHQERNRAIMQSLHGGMKTAYQVAGDIRWMADQGGCPFQALAVWDKRMAVTETIAHLKLLVEEDRVGNVDMDGASLYISKE